MGIPTALALHAISLKGFITAEGVLDGAPEDVMNTRAPVGGRWPFVKRKRRPAVARRHARGESLLLIPEFEQFCLDFGKV